MAWQSPSAHAPQEGNGQGGNNGGNQNQLGNGSQTLGTEYTLQGVMRFLQTEWHRHERDRNSWEIERAEMKARIAKLEGENRASKRLQQGSEARIKMLEMALKRERASKQDPTGKAQGDSSAQADPIPPKHIPAPSSLFNPNLMNPYKADEARAKNRMYLEKCLQEITYLLTPQSHPPPQQHVNLDPNILQQQQQQQQQQLRQQQPQQPQHQHQQQSNQQPLDSILSQQPQQQPPVPSNFQPSPESLLQSQSSNLGPFDRSKLFYSQSRDDSHSQNQQQAGGQSESSDRASEKQRYNSVSRVTGGSNSTTNLFSSSEDSSSKDSDGWDFDELHEVPTFNKPTTPVNDTDSWSNRGYSSVKNGNLRIGSRGRKNSMSRRMSAQEARDYVGSISGSKGGDAGNFKVRFALRGHLDVVRAVVFTGGGTPAEPEICTAGDDGVLKRWHLPGVFGIHAGVDVDVPSHFTHRGHSGIVTCLAACPPADNSGTGDGWIFSGGQDSTIKIWERGRVEAKATLVGHTDAVWSICVLPTSGDGGFERMLLASGAADGTVKIWSFTPKPSSISSGASSASNSIRGSAYPQSAPPGNTNTPFSHSLISTITRPGVNASPTCITPLSITGENFIVSYDDAAVIIYDTASGEEISAMASGETYDGTKATGVNAVVATTMSLQQGIHSSSSAESKAAAVEEENVLPGATGLKGGVYGIVISGHEDRYIRFYDANSGQCTYTMLAHPAAISSLALSPDGRELVSGGHDASLRFWSMEKRSCIKEMSTHRLMRGEGVCTVIWSADGRWVVSGGGDGVVKVYSR
ncbi:WD40-repeat-containing domain protein [Kalaharituber pfeilii]|nr:WD40-repeat-containing domain protein [Kalaharituber pfeilii]